MAKAKKEKKNDLDTEAHILACAKKVFITKGFAATRMQDIAEETGMNQALLHYYFRSKDKLFEQVFDREVLTFFQSVGILWLQDKPVLDIFDDIIEHEINRFRQSPHLPLFIIHEMSQNAERMTGKIKTNVFANDPQKMIFAKIKQAMENGEIRTVSPEHIFVTVLSLVTFPFIGRPMVMLMIGTDDKGFEQFMEERVAFSKHFLRTYLTSK